MLPIYQKSAVIHILKLVPVIMYLSLSSAHAQDQTALGYHGHQYDPVNQAFLRTPVFLVFQAVVDNNGEDEPDDPEGRTMVYPFPESLLDWLGGPSSTFIILPVVDNNGEDEPDDPEGRTMVYPFPESLLDWLVGPGSTIIVYPVVDNNGEDEPDDPEGRIFQFPILEFDERLRSYR